MLRCLAPLYLLSTAAGAYSLDAPRHFVAAASARHARGTVASAAPAAAPPELASFRAWLSESGIASEAVEPAKLPGWGVCLVAGPDGVAQGDTLLSIPTALHLTPSSVAAGPVGAAVARVVPSDDHSALLALGLLEQLSRGEANCSSWPYIELLPSGDEMVGMPLLWADEERAQLLSGSHLEGCVAQARQQLLEQWAAVEAVLPAHAEVFPRSVFNAAGYLWAHAVVLSRALPFGEELHLIPLLDLANHAAGSPHACSIGVSGEGGAVSEAWQVEGKEAAAVLTAGAGAAAGEQVFIDYGEAGWRSSWEMLYTYGFVPGSSVEEWIAAGGRPLFFDGVSPSDELLPQKRALLAALGASEGAADGQWLDLKPTADQCVAMAPLLRLANLSPGDASLEEGVRRLAEALAEWRADPTALWSALQRPVGAAVEAKVAEQVLSVCEEALAALPPADELAPRAKPDQGLPGDGTAEAERARCAARVMLGERSALEACVSVWEKVRAAAAPA